MPPFPTFLQPIAAITCHSFQALLAALPRYLPNLLQQSPSNGLPVFVMLPLDTACTHPQLPFHHLSKALSTLSSIGVHGIMLDVWWSLCEPTPGQYSFDTYVNLFQICKRIGLKVQATMSFHACGTNVGDTVNIPLPSWVLTAGDQHQVWFRDRAAFDNREYISFGADHEPFLPCSPTLSPPHTTHPPKIDSPDTNLRTPVQAYGSFVQAFVDTMRAHNLMSSTIVELQIGLGPCGELRYPSYPMTEGKWQFPGIGEFQCFDKYLLKDLLDSVHQSDSQVVKDSKLPPDDAGTYNDTPWDTRFFRTGFKSEPGAFFLNWYSRRLLKHGDDVLNLIRTVIPTSDSSVTLAVKISGIHWWRFTSCRAAEATAGYVTSGGRPGYTEIAKLLGSHGAILDFTCLEMRTIDQPWFKARCGPRQLVAEVFENAREAGIAVAGENALERYDWKAYVQIASAFRRTRAKRYGFTLLRLGDGLLEAENLERLERFVQVMKQIE